MALVRTPQTQRELGAGIRQRCSEGATHQAACTRRAQARASTGTTCHTPKTVARCEEVGLLPITYPTCFHTDAWPPSSGSSRGRRFDPIPKPGLPGRLTHARRAHYTQPGSPEPGARWHRVELFPSAVLASELQTSVKKSCLGRCTSGTRRGETDCGSATNCPTSIPDPGVGANAPHRAGRGPTGEARC